MRKGFAIAIVSKFVLLIATIALFASAIVFLTKSDTVFESMSKIDDIRISTIMGETCYVLDNPGDDREAKKVDVYENIPIEYESKPADIGAVDSFALSFEIKGIIHESSWNIAGWNVTCKGVDADGNPKVYTLVRWDYEEIYPEGYLHINAKKFFDDALIKYLIDNTKSGYKPEWECENKVTVNVETAGASGSGTDEMVKLCYYLNLDFLSGEASYVFSEPDCIPTCSIGPGCRTSALANSFPTGADCCDDSKKCYSCNTGYTWDGAACKPPTSVVTGADSVKPVVASFGVDPTTAYTNSPITVSYTVTDNKALEQVELWRKKEAGSWEKIKTADVSGTSASGSFTDSLSTAGTYYYAIHVVDQAGNVEDGSGTSRTVSVSSTSPPTENKFLQTYALRCGGSAITAEEVPILAKFDMIDANRFHYDDVGSNTFSAIKAINPDIVIFLYQLANPRDNTDGMSIANLNNLGRWDISRSHSMGNLNTGNPDLFLLNAGSSRIYNPAYPTEYRMDVGADKWINYWVEATLNDITGRPWTADGVFIDVVPFARTSMSSMPVGAHPLRC